MRASSSVGLDAETGRPGHDEAVAPRAKVLNAPGSRVRVVDVHPVVRKRLFLVDDQRDEAEVAIREATGRGNNLVGRRRIQAQNELAQRNARRDAVDEKLALAPVRPDSHALDDAVRVVERVAAVVQQDRDPRLLDALLEGLPHLSRPEPRIAKPFDQRGRRLAVEAENARDGMSEREVLDALGGPLGSNL